MVLAIGLLVDDAIVVVENVERIMAEEGLSPQEATLKSMDQITGRLIGIGLVLSAVFVPDGLLRRLHRRHLPSVLHHHHLGDAAVGGGGVDADAGALRVAFETHSQGARAGRHTVWFLRPFFLWFDRVFSGAATGMSGWWDIRWRTTSVIWLPIS